MSEKPPTIAEAVAQVVAQMDGPLPLDEFIARVLAIHPSQARNPAASIRNLLRYGEIGRSLVFSDPKTLMPLHIVMQGVRFRIPLSLQEVQKGLLCLDPAFIFFLRQEIPREQMTLLDEAGRTLPTRVVQVKQKGETPLGPVEYTIPALDLADWFREQRVQPGGSILVTIEDWQAGRFRLEYESAQERKKHRQEIERRNRELADVLYELLEKAHDERISCSEALGSAYLRLSDPRGYPGDHWLGVVEEDPRMRTNGIEIFYSDFFLPLERIFQDFLEKPARRPKERISPEQGRQVYRFKAALRHRPGLWRRIEIRGDQTLADFNAILMDAFNYDWDHLAGFWKRVRRGESNRYREVELGNVDPVGGGSGAGRHIAGLGLQPGDTLKYVYDFGDWIEHLITLEEIGRPEEGAKYPRIVEQNRPRYSYCESCRAAGKRTVATWVCLECSERKGRAVMVCEKCLDKKHPDHYAEEILY